MVMPLLLLKNSPPGLLAPPPSGPTGRFLIDVKMVVVYVLMAGVKIGSILCFENYE
jgi:hypothetical protein